MNTYQLWSDFFSKICVYLKHLCYLYNRNITPLFSDIHRVQSREIRVLVSLTSNVTCESREVSCLKPILI